jgi:hypothetical protein
MADTTGYPYPPFVVEKESGSGGMDMNSLFPWLFLFGGGRGMNGLFGGGGYGDGVGRGVYGPQSGEVAEREFDAVQNQLNSLSNQIAGLESESEHKETLAAVSSLRDTTQAKLDLMSSNMADCCCSTKTALAGLTQQLDTNTMIVKNDITDLKNVSNVNAITARNDATLIQNAVNFQAGEIRHDICTQTNTLSIAIERSRDDIIDAIKDVEARNLAAALADARSEISDLKQTDVIKNKIDAAISAIVTHMNPCGGNGGGH